MKGKLATTCNAYVDQMIVESVAAQVYITK